MIPTDPPRLAETSEVLLLPTSVNLKDLLSYQDVMQTIEREFHLHEGQEREIIMKLWLKNQSMISVLHRYRYLLQDLKLDDQDFLGGLKKIREMISFAHCDVHHLRERIELLESQNQFLEHEFQRQLDRLSREKNEQIHRLTQIIDQTCSPHRDLANAQESTIVNESLLKKFMEQNAELQHEIEVLRVKLEHTFAFVNDKLDQQKDNQSSTSLLKSALERIHQTELKLQELQQKSSSQREENDLLKYFIEKSHPSSNTEQTQLLRTLEQRSLEREIDRVRQELELTEKKTRELRERFEHADESTQFKLEQFQLTCDVLREHINACHQRLEAISTKKHIDPTWMENELSRVRQELIENRESHAAEMKALQKKYAQACERLNSGTIEKERAQMRYEESEKEKSEIRQQSDHLTQSLAKMTAKYKEKMSSMKVRIESSDRRRDEIEQRCEYLQSQLTKLHQELLAKEETIFEKERVIQYHQREVHLEKASTDEQERNEWILQNQLLHNELERLKAQMSTFESSSTDSTLQSRVEELRTKMIDFEQRFLEEKSRRESYQIQLKLLEEENKDLREIMSQMRRRHDDNAEKSERDRKDEIQKLIDRAELHARQYMTTFNLHQFSTSSTLARIIPIASSSSVFS